jgi:hypothetical protein
MNPTDVTDLAWVFQDGVPPHVSFEALSARIDGELTAAELTLVNHHLAECEACSASAALFGPVEIAPVEIAPVEIAPVEIAPVENGLEVHDSFVGTQREFRQVGEPAGEEKTSAIAAAMAEWDSTQLRPEAMPEPSGTKPGGTVVAFHRKRSTRFFGAAAVVAVLTVGSSSVLQSAFVDSNNDTLSADLATEQVSSTVQEPEANAEFAAEPDAEAPAEAESEDGFAAETTVQAADPAADSAADSPAESPEPPAAALPVDTIAPSAAADIGSGAEGTTKKAVPEVVASETIAPPPAPAPAPTAPTKPPQSAAPSAGAPAAAAPAPAPGGTPSTAAKKRTVAATASNTNAPNTDLGSLGSSDSVDSAVSSFAGRVGVTAKPESVVAGAVPAQGSPGSIPATIPPADGSPDPGQAAVPASSVPAAASPSPEIVAEPVPDAPISVPDATADPTCATEAARYGTIVRRATSTVPITGELKIFLVNKSSTARIIVFDSRCAVVANRVAE